MIPVAILLLSRYCRRVWSETTTFFSLELAWMK